jgi:hypothetical protein
MPTTLKQSELAVPGQPFGYYLSPEPADDCEIVWMIDGRTVSEGDIVNGLEVVRIDRIGAIVLQTDNRDVDPSVSVTVDCGAEEGPEQLVDLLGIWIMVAPNCVTEPCKSAVAAYRTACREAGNAVNYNVLTMLCLRYKLWSHYFFGLFALLMLALFAHISCSLSNASPQLCDHLLTAIMVISIAFAIATARLAYIYSRLYVFQQICKMSENRVRAAYLAMTLYCPPECVLPEMKFNCDC